MTRNMNGDVVMVTGVGRAEGLGFEVCRALAALGSTVLLTARDPARAGALADQLCESGDVRPFALDLTVEASITALTDHVERTFGRLDVLINNAAGVSAFGVQPSSADLGAARHVMDVTLFGTWHLTQACLPLLRRSEHPRIVNVSSGAGSHGDPAFGLAQGNAMGPGYGVAKAALNALTHALAVELEPEGFLVNAVCPGFTATFEGGEAVGARPVRDGAQSILWAAILPPGGPTGGFFRDGQPLPW